MTIRLRILLAAHVFALCGADGAAKDDKYNEPIKAYQSEMSREPVDVRNPNYFRVIGESQANRSIVSSRKGDQNSVVDTDSRDPGQTGDAIVNIASPRIDGDVRGDVNIIIERGAIKGNITSIKR